MMAKEEALASKKREKDTMKLKKAASAVLTALSVPLAAFDTDVQTLRMLVKPELNYMVEVGDTLLKKGAQMKEEALKAMQDGNECPTTLAMSRAFLDELRGQAKAIKSVMK